VKILSAVTDSALKNKKTKQIYSLLLIFKSHWQWDLKILNAVIVSANKIFTAVGDGVKNFKHCQ
jgi:hypothetical protein